MPKKLPFWLTEEEIGIITDKLVRDKSQDELNDYILRFFKNSAIFAKSLEKQSLKEREIDFDDIDKVKLDFDEKYTRDGAKKRILMLYGDAIYEGLIYYAKFQQLMNKVDDKMHFDSVDHFLSILLEEQIDQLKVEAFSAELEKDYKKSKQKQDTQKTQGTE